MVQNLLLGMMVFLSVLLIISLFKKPLEGQHKNPCRFKILPPKYRVEGSKKYASFSIIVEKKHRYFINVPFNFKFYSQGKFKTEVLISYSVPDEPSEKILEKIIEFRPSERNESKTYTTYITNVIVGKIIIDIQLEIHEGNPSIEFEILENSVCKLVKEHKLQLIFPEN